MQHPTLSSSLLALLLVSQSMPTVQASCSIGPAIIESCGPVGQETVANFRVSENCYFQFFINWDGQAVYGYSVNASDLVSDDDPSSTPGIANHTIAFNYTEAGEYDVQFTIRGFTNFTNMVEDQWMIETTRSPQGVSIGEDNSCTILTNDRDAAATWSLGMTTALTVLAGWVFL